MGVIVNITDTTDRHHTVASWLGLYKKWLYAGVTCVLVALFVLGWQNGLLVSAVPPQTSLVSVAHDGSNLTIPSSIRTRVNIESSKVAFTATYPGHNHSNVFMRDVINNTTQVISVTPSGNMIETSHSSELADMTPDGRYVLFGTGSAELLSQPASTSHRRLYVRDTVLNTTEHVSLTNANALPNATVDPGRATISSNGRFIVFHSAATNIVSGDTNQLADIFVRDRILGTTTIVSSAISGTPGNGVSGAAPSMSCDGGIVSFVSGSDNLVNGDTNGVQDIFVRSRIATQDIMRNVTAHANGYSAHPQLSCDGRVLLFESTASNLVDNDTNGQSDIFAYDLDKGTYERINVSNSGGQLSHTESYPQPHPVSSDGRYVVFSTRATAVANDTNSALDVFVRDRLKNTTTRVSFDENGNQLPFHPFSGDAGMNIYGTSLAYVSSVALSAADTDTTQDVYLVRGLLD